MLRPSYVKAFGEGEAAKLEAAATEHFNGINNARIGSDPFRHAVLICLGYDCVAKFAEHHGIGVSDADFRAWCVKHAHSFMAHDGDCDYLALFAGTYDFLKEAAANTN